jgi:secreted trypsin-like serine protease
MRKSCERACNVALFRNLAIALSFATLAACNQEPMDEGSIGETSEPIIGGQTTTGDPAVVLLISYPSDHSYYDSCTASLIAPTVLLTAGHCVDAADHGGNTFGIFPGPDASAYTTLNSLIPHLVAVQEVHAHPSYDPNSPFTADIGVAILAQPLAIPILPIFRDAPAQNLVGQPARIVGYGQAVYGQFSATKRSATTVLAAIDPGDTVTVGDDTKHSCVGDSGGPALVELNGVETILGEDSYTDVTGCIGPAHYRRTDLYLAFLDQYAPPMTTTSSSTNATSSATGSSTGSGNPSVTSNASGMGNTSGEGGGNTTGGDGGAQSKGANSGGCSIGNRSSATSSIANDSRNASAAVLIAMGLSTWIARRRLTARGRSQSST